MPKLVDHVSYRKSLLVRCFDLFAERGYSALTMRQIAEALKAISAENAAAWFQHCGY